MEGSHSTLRLFRRSSYSSLESKSGTATVTVRNRMDLAQMKNAMSSFRKIAQVLVAACDSPAAPVYAFAVHALFLATIFTVGLGSAISFTALALLLRLAKLVAGKWLKRTEGEEPSDASRTVQATFEIDGDYRTVRLTLPVATVEALRQR